MRHSAVTFFLPGIGGHAVFHGPLVARIASHNKVVALDYEDCTSADDLRTAYALRRAMLIEEIASQHQNATINIVGCSYGATQALRIAGVLARPGLRLLLVSPALIDLAPPKVLRSAVLRLGYGLARVAPTAIFRWSELTLDRTQLLAERAWLYRQGETHARRQLRRRVEDLVEFLVRARARPLLDSLVAASLTIAGGSRDPLYRGSRTIPLLVSGSVATAQVTVPGPHAINLTGSHGLFSVIDAFYAVAKQGEGDAG